ncbi:MAG: hypothetical protein LKJ17_05665 [Oscillospiraceae bacterium]|jgi:hypothetical protein|nr:hypothetical protein [Oscillospiraceae bacterium]
MNILAGITILLAFFGLLISVRGENISFLQAMTALLLFLLSLSGGVLAFLFLIWY